MKLVTIRKHSSFSTSLFVLSALLKRESITRFGKFKLGFVWMMLDPLVSTIVLGLVFGPFIGRSSGEIPYAFFLLCGFMNLKCLTGPMMAGIGAIESNKGLMIFKQLKPIDPFIARFVFELAISSFSFIVFCAFGIWFGMQISLQHIFQLIASFLLTWLMGCGAGLILGVLVVKTKEVQKIATYIQRPLFFLSCVMYSISSIPNEYAKLLLLNPLAHTIEQTRISLFPNYIANGTNLIYPTFWTLCLLSLGLAIYRNNLSSLSAK